MKKVSVVKGDGIGPEVIDATLEVLHNMDLPIEFVDAEMGLECNSIKGAYIPEASIEVIKGSDCCLFGAITSPPSNVPDYRSPILYLRKEFGLFANVRPVKRPCPDIGIIDLDLTIIRENTEGMYTGIEREEDGAVILERKVSEKACRRLVRYAINHCIKNGIGTLTCVHKANVLRRSDGLFRRVFFEEMEGTSIKARELLVDAAAAAMVTRPLEQRCYVTLNLYGDILSDEAAALIGGLGFAPSGSYGEKFALFEPTHGSAPDIAGKGVANPTAALLSACMMLEYLGMEGHAISLRSALQRTLLDGVRTPDAGGRSGTLDFSRQVIKRLSVRD
ncbi:MAG: isocitrate/isopropylmalate dehydrogenase family protein [Methanomassiliicoccales archaeon]|nr:MAG: isocitrate/isopropylmalate dehydrogenase family protein [Methanomassiliicoccales archaeon]